MTEGVGREPTAADEARFWELVESAWAACGTEAVLARRRLIERDPAVDDGDVIAHALEGWMEQVLNHLGRLCAAMSRAELTDLDRVVERQLYKLDRQEVHEH